MKKYLKKMLSIMLAAIMLIGIMPVQTQAASKISFPKKIVLTAYKKPVWSYFVVGGVSKKGKITKLKSSKTGVLSVKGGYEEDMDGYVISMKAKKAGTSRVTFTAKAGSTIKKITCNVTVKKYTSPFKSIKVSGKSITSAMKKSNIVTLDYKKAKEKVTYQLKKNWELDGMYFDNGDYKEDAMANNLVFEAENGELEMHLYNTKTGQSEVCYVRWK